MSIKVKLDDVLKYEQPTKYIVESINYNNSFPIPVLTAGKSFILGYTDETHGVYNDLPVIIFDDFTTAFHYVDFPFKVKSSAMKILKPLKEKADLRYLYYKMHTISVDTDLHKRYWISKYSQLQIQIPPLEQQKKIAEILDNADNYRQKTKALIAKYDELTQSLFLDMFGDPVKNEKGWDIDSLNNYGKYKNGLNYSKNENGIEIKYLGVGDFKSHYKISSMDSLSQLSLSKLPSDDFLLKNGDLVFVRSNGNKELVGRCIVVYPNETVLTFSGFCIRYRIESRTLSPIYLSQMFHNKSFKNTMLEGGRGANIQNINQQILAKLNIPLPPISLQNQFAERIQVIEQQKAQAQASLEKAEELFNSLLQRAFNGELV